MIRPESCADCIGTVKFLCGVATNDRQYTFVEVWLTSPLCPSTEEAEIYFCIPDSSDPKDELALLNALSPTGTVVSDAITAWTESPSASNVVHSAVEINQAGAPEKTAKVSGCSGLVSLKIPRRFGVPVVVTAAWSHLLKKSRIFVPTQNESMSGWRYEIVVMQGRCNNNGKESRIPLTRCFRFDIAAAECGVVFKSMDGARMLVRSQDSLPYYNLWIPVGPEPPPPRRTFESISGAVVVDATKFAVVTCYDVDFCCVPTVCGCFLKNEYVFQGAHVPMTIPERFTRETPATFEDDPDGSGDVLLRIGPSFAPYRISPNLKERAYAMWWAPVK